MISPKTGEFKLDDCELLVHSELSLSEFISKNIPVHRTMSSNETGWNAFYFLGSIDGMKAKFSIDFGHGKIHKFTWIPDGGTFSSSSKNFNDWITKVSGVNPPYEYDWGYIDTEPDEKSGVDGIKVHYLRAMIDRGITDAQLFYESRRAYFEYLEARVRDPAIKKNRKLVDLLREFLDSFKPDVR